MESFRCQVCLTTFGRIFEIKKHMQSSMHQKNMKEIFQKDAFGGREFPTIITMNTLNKHGNKLIIGLSLLTLCFSTETTIYFYLCHVCEETCSPSDIARHLLSGDHCSNYFNYMDPNVLSFSWIPSMDMRGILKLEMAKEINKKGTRQIQMLDLPVNLLKKLESNTYAEVIRSLSENDKLLKVLKASELKRTMIQTYQRDRNRKHPLLGMQHLVECIRVGPIDRRHFLCTLCNLTLASHMVIKHVLSFDHIFCYFRAWHPSTLLSKESYREYSTFGSVILDFAKQTEEIHGSANNNMKQVRLEPDEYASVNFACYTEALKELESIRKKKEESSLITVVTPGKKLEGRGFVTLPVTIRCQGCKFTFDTINQYLRHIDTWKHKQMLKEFFGGAQRVGGFMQTKGKLPHLKFYTYLKDNSKKNRPVVGVSLVVTCVSTEAQVDSFYVCFACGDCFPESSVNQHFNSQKHLIETLLYLNPWRLPLAWETFLDEQDLRLAALEEEQERGQNLMIMTIIDLPSSIFRDLTPPSYHKVLNGFKKHNIFSKHDIPPRETRSKLKDGDRFPLLGRQFLAKHGSNVAQHQPTKVSFLCLLCERRLSDDECYAHVFSREHIKTFIDRLHPGSLNSDTDAETLLDLAKQADSINGFMSVQDIKLERPIWEPCTYNKVIHILASANGKRNLKPQIVPRTKLVPRGTLKDTGKDHVKDNGPEKSRVLADSEKKTGEKPTDNCEKTEVKAETTDTQCAEKEDDIKNLTPSEKESVKTTTEEVTSAGIETCQAIKEEKIEEPTVSEPSEETIESSKYSDMGLKSETEEQSCKNILTHLESDACKEEEIKRPVSDESQDVRHNDDKGKEIKCEREQLTSKQRASCSEAQRLPSSQQTEGTTADEGGSGKPSQERVEDKAPVHQQADQLWQYLKRTSREPVIGLSALLECHCDQRDPIYLCESCSVKIAEKDIISHVTGVNHQKMYLLGFKHLPQPPGYRQGMKIKHLAALIEKNTGYGEAQVVDLDEKVYDNVLKLNYKSALQIVKTLKAQLDRVGESRSTSALDTLFTPHARHEGFAFPDDFQVEDMEIDDDLKDNEAKPSLQTAAMAVKTETSFKTADDPPDSSEDVKMTHTKEYESAHDTKSYTTVGPIKEETTSRLVGSSQGADTSDAVVTTCTKSTMAVSECTTKSFSSATDTSKTTAPVSKLTANTAFCITATTSKAGESANKCVPSTSRATAATIQSATANTSTTTTTSVAPTSRVTKTTTTRSGTSTTNSSGTPTTKSGAKTTTTTPSGTPTTNSGAKTTTIRSGTPTTNSGATTTTTRSGTPTTKSGTPTTNSGAPTTNSGATTTTTTRSGATTTTTTRSGTPTTNSGATTTIRSHSSTTTRSGATTNTNTNSREAAYKCASSPFSATATTTKLTTAQPNTSKTTTTSATPTDSSATTTTTRSGTSTTCSSIATTTTNSDTPTTGASTTAKVSSNKESSVHEATCRSPPASKTENVSKTTVTAQPMASSVATAKASETSVKCGNTETPAKTALVNMSVASNAEVGQNNHNSTAPAAPHLSTSENKNPSTEPSHTSTSERKLMISGPKVGLKYLIEVSCEGKKQFYCWLCSARLRRSGHVPSFRHKLNYVRMKLPRWTAQPSEMKSKVNELVAQFAEAEAKEGPQCSQRMKVKMDVYNELGDLPGDKAFERLTAMLGQKDTRISPSTPDTLRVWTPESAFLSPCEASSPDDDMYMPHYGTSGFSPDIHSEQENKHVLQNPLVQIPVSISKEERNLAVGQLEGGQGLKSSEREADALISDQLHSCLTLNKNEPEPIFTAGIQDAVGGKQETCRYYMETQAEITVTPEVKKPPAGAAQISFQSELSGPFAQTSDTSQKTPDKRNQQEMRDPRKSSPAVSKTEPQNQPRPGQGSENAPGQSGSSSLPTIMIGKRTTKSSSLSRFLKVKLRNSYPVVGLDAVWECEVMPKKASQRTFFLCESCKERLCHRNICQHMTSDKHLINHMLRQYPKIMEYWQDEELLPEVKLQISKEVAWKVSRREHHFEKDAQSTLLAQDLFDYVQTAPFSEALQILHNLKEQKLSIFYPPVSSPQQKDQRPEEQQNRAEPLHTEMQSAQAQETDKTQDNAPVLDSGTCPSPRETCRNQSELTPPVSEHHRPVTEVPVKQKEVRSESPSSSVVGEKTSQTLAVSSGDESPLSRKRPAFASVETLASSCTSNPQPEEDRLPAKSMRISLQPSTESASESTPVLPAATSLLLSPEDKTTHTESEEPHKIMALINLITLERERRSKKLSPRVVAQEGEVSELPGANGSSTGVVESEDDPTFEQMRITMPGKRRRCDSKFPLDKATDCTALPSATPADHSDPQHQRRVAAQSMSDNMSQLKASPSCEASTLNPGQTSQPGAYTEPDGAGVSLLPINPIVTARPDPADQQFKSHYTHTTAYNTQGYRANQVADSFSSVVTAGRSDASGGYGHSSNFAHVTYGPADYHSSAAVQGFTSQVKTPVNSFYQGEGYATRGIYPSQIMTEQGANNFSLQAFGHSSVTPAAPRWASLEMQQHVMHQQLMQQQHHQMQQQLVQQQQHQMQQQLVQQQHHQMQQQLVQQQHSSWTSAAGDIRGAYEPAYDGRRSSHHSDQQTPKF
uniref:mucin-4-like isoform X2 n=1 Tax=Semicossyphus pulcher TaxID=241346 RepID=UPI0037E8A24F